MLKKLCMAIGLIREKVDRELPAQQLLIFLIIGINPGISTCDILTEVDVNRASLSRSVKRLSAKGLVRKELNRQADKGLVYHLTDDGNGVYIDIAKCFAHTE